MVQIYILIFYTPYFFIIIFIFYYFLYFIPYYYGGIYLLFNLFYVNNPVYLNFFQINSNGYRQVKRCRIILSGAYRYLKKAAYSFTYGSFLLY